MKPLVLRSPNVAEGGPVHVVRLVEAEPFARGGLAKATLKREINLHLSTPELKQLSSTWGKPSLNIKGIPEYSFKKGSLKKFAEGGAITGWNLPDIKVPTPVSPTAATPGRTQNAGPKDYYTYGEGPEYNFFNNNVTPPQPTFPHTDVSIPKDPGSSGSGIGNLAAVGAGLAGASQIAGALGYDNALTQGAGAIGKGLTGNYAGALKDGKALYNNLTGTGTTAGTGAGTAAGLGAAGAGLGAVSGAGALGAAAPIATDAALSNLGTVTAGQLFGTSASAAAGAGAGSLGTAGGAGALGAGTGASAGTAGAAGATSGATGALAGSGIATALPLAAIGWAIADAANKGGDIKSGATSALIEQLTKNGTITLADPRTQTYKLPDGRFLRTGGEKSARTVSELLRTGDQAGAEKAYQEWLDNAYRPGGELSFKDWNAGKNYTTPYVPPQGHAHGGGVFSGAGSSGSWEPEAATLDPEKRHVRGPGTGRSDSIPAQLSDGEYVLTAEDVSLLGDGSNEAGAQRLDQFRQQIRKHKGGALARGKISPNAKAPMAYLKGAR